MDEPTPTTSEIRRCVTCGEIASYDFGPPGGGPVQLLEWWYCRDHRPEGEQRWAARYGRPTIEA